MNSQIKQKWIDSLRSGKYDQTQGKLYSGDGFCCLGVLCDIYAKEVGDKSCVKKDPSKTIDDDKWNYWYFDDQSECLPECVKDWAELNEDDPVVINPVVGEDYVTTLAYLNDGGATFEDLAEMIEAQL
jgi:hypothetical protein